jgi:hypothetical protein
MKFKDWMEHNSVIIPDAYSHFVDLILESDYEIKENSDNPIIKQVEFVLEEASDLPWGSESWLEKNTKIEKTKEVKSFTKKGKRIVFVPFLINLLPAKQSGINLCMCSTKHCAATCLHSAGNIGALVDKTMSRLRKTWFLALDRDKAFSQIANQIKAKKQKIDKFNATSKDTHQQLIIRLNGTSDIIWRVLTDVAGKNLFEMFPDVVFYDYSKHSKEMENFIRGEIIDDDGNKQGRFPPNYHLTFSYGGPGGSMSNYRKTLLDGENLAVPFGPGKTSALDYMEFPKDIADLIVSPKDKKARIYYPESFKKKQKKEYVEKILNKIKEEGNYVSPEELAPFAGKTLLPGLFMCHEVIDGDDYDARFLDDLLLPSANTANSSNDQIEIDSFERKKKKYGIVVGLTGKGDLTFSAYKKEKGWDHAHTGFMVGPEDAELNNSCKLMLNDPAKESFLRKKTEIYKKIAKAIMTIRNFDARHIQAYDKDAEGNLITHIKRNASSKPTQTYLTSKGRITKEMNDLIEVIQAVLRNQNVRPTNNTHKQAADQASKLRTYLTNPETIKILNSDEFKRKANQIGIDINFESLARLVDITINRDPEGAKPTLIPSDMLRRLGGENKEDKLN